MRVVVGFRVDRHVPQRLVVGCVMMSHLAHGGITSQPSCPIQHIQGNIWIDQKVIEAINTHSIHCLQAKSLTK
jgi:hypothetical protein